jgi:hypothetical protein
VDVGSIGRTTYKLLSCDCVRVASQDPEEELAASNLLTVNHGDFFTECQKPACHFFVKGYGHVDMLDDDIGLMGIALNMMCSHGNSRKPMRRFVGGVAVAFMKAHLLGDDSDLMAIRDGQHCTSGAKSY